MAKAILTLSLIVLSVGLIGCSGMDSGSSLVVPPAMQRPAENAPTLKLARASEADIVEQVIQNRQAYRQGLMVLKEHYMKKGNNLKLNWVEKELDKLDDVPQYKYIIEAEVHGSNLSAKNAIPEADYMYFDAVQTEKKARTFKVLVDEDLLRVALEKYNTIINKHPSSDKIDDCAFNAAGIYEHFKDYSIALLYYQRAYQWDPETIHPARYKAAYILDNYLARRNEALEVYKDAIAKDPEHSKWKDYAQARVQSLSSSGEEID